MKTTLCLGVINLTVGLTLACVAERRNSSLLSVTAGFSAGIGMVLTILSAAALAR